MTKLTPPPAPPPTRDLPVFDKRADRFLRCPISRGHTGFARWWLAAALLNLIVALALHAAGIVEP